MRGIPDMIGKRFGNLTVVNLDHINAAGLYMYECQCRCGNTIVARGVWLRNGNIVSCGCPLIKDKKEPVAISVGQKVRFDPFEGIKGFGASDDRGNYVTGTVVSVNEPHKWFSVEYGNPKMMTSFKFCEIGSVVKVCGK